MQDVDDVEIPEAIRDDPEAVKRFRAGIAAKRAQDQRREAEIVRAFQPIVDQIKRREDVAIDAARLSQDERNRLWQIVADDPEEIVDERTGARAIRRTMNIADTDRREYEKLVEKAAGRPVFRERREAAKKASERRSIMEAARKALRPQRLKYASQGAVQLPGWLFDSSWLGLSSEFGITDLGMLALVVGLIENHQGVVDSVNAAEVHDDELALDPNYFPGSHVRYGFDGTQLEVQQTLEYLAAQDLIAITKLSDRVWRVRKGTAILAEEDAAAKAATSHAKAGAR